MRVRPQVALFLRFQLVAENGYMDSTTGVGAYSPPPPFFNITFIGVAWEELSPEGLYSPPLAAEHAGALVFSVMRCLLSPTNKDSCCQSVCG